MDLCLVNKIIVYFKGVVNEWDKRSKIFHSHLCFNRLIYHHLKIMIHLVYQNHYHYQNLILIYFIWHLKNFDFY